MPHLAGQVISLTAKFMMSAPVTDGLLDATFSAFADPTRRAILARQARGNAPVGDLAKPFDFALPTISRHLKVLERARLIEKQKDASRRECQLRGAAAASIEMARYVHSVLASDPGVIGRVCDARAQPLTPTSALKGAKMTPDREFQRERTVGVRRRIRVSSAFLFKGVDRSGPIWSLVRPQSVDCGAVRD